MTPYEAEIIKWGIEAVAVGQVARISRTVSESDVYLFAGISGDLHPQHVDETYGQSTRYGRRIAHGALLVGFMSAAFTRWCQTWLEGRTSQPVVSYGYDRIRFIRPVYIADTVRTEHRIVEVNAGEAKAFAQVTCINQRGEIVAAATHILKFV